MGEDMSENIIKAGRGISQERLSEIHEKQTQDAANLKKSQQDLRDKAPVLMKFAKLNKRWKEYELNEDEILELGVEGDVRFFVKLKNVTVCWFALYGTPPARDPCGLRNIKDLTPFQVTKLSIEDIWCSMDNPKKTSDIQLVCLDELKVGYGKTREDSLPVPNGYISIIYQYKGSRESEPDSHVLVQRTRRVMDLWALTEDVERYESENHLIEEHPIKTEHSNEQPTPSQQEDLTALSEIPGNTYTGTKEIESAFAAHRIPLKIKQIMNLHKQGLLVMGEVPRGKRKSATVTDLAIINCKYQRKLKKKQKK